MIIKPLPLDRAYHGDPNMKALKRMGVISQGSTLGCFILLPQAVLLLGLAFVHVCF